MVDDRTRCITQFQTDLQAVCSGFLEITGLADHLWLLNLITSVDDLTNLARLRRSTRLKIPGVGKSTPIKSKPGLALYLGMAALDNSSGTYQGSKNVSGLEY